MQKVRLIIPTFFLVILALTSCDKDKVVNDNSLKNIKWIALEMKGITAASSRDTLKAHVIFRDTTAGGYSGCNVFGGNFNFTSSDDGATFDMKNVFSTQIACNDPVGKFETAFFQALDEADFAKIEGDKLTLFKGNTVIGRLKSE
jgi:heat shock protein HslJ